MTYIFLICALFFLRSWIILLSLPWIYFWGRLSICASLSSGILSCFFFWNIFPCHLILSNFVYLWSLFLKLQDCNSVSGGWVWSRGCSLLGGMDWRLPNGVSVARSLPSGGQSLCLGLCVFRGSCGGQAACLLMDGAVLLPGCLFGFLWCPSPGACSLLTRPVLGVVMAAFRRALTPNEYSPVPPSPVSSPPR